MYQTLISVDKLKQDFNAKTWVIIDCRFDLSDPTKGHRLYEDAHIPEAFFMDLEQDLSSHITPVSGRHPLPDPEHFAKKAAEAGVTLSSQVVVYDDCKGAMASRAWWLFRQIGVKNVAVLEGGYSAWLASGGEVTEEPKLPISDPDVALPLFDVAGTFNTEQVFNHLHEIQLVDARDPARFRGEVEPIDRVAGHIPGAINRPFSANFDESGDFKQPQQLKEEWAALINVNKSVVHMCGSGVTACHNILSMEHAGLTQSLLYADSWSEWIRDDARPIEKG